MVDALDSLVRFHLQPGRRHDSIGVPPLIEGITFDALLGGRALDVDWPSEALDGRGAAAVIPSRKNRKVIVEHDREM